MGLNQSKLLELGLSVATAIALSYKIAYYILRDQPPSTNELLLRSHHNECCVEEKPLVTSFPKHLNNNEDDDSVKNSEGPIISVTLAGQNLRDRTTKEVNCDNVTVIGIQCGPAPIELINTEVQCDHALEETDDVVTMKLKLAHANIFMLKKHFDEELSKQIGGNLDVALYRSSELGNYLAVRGDTSDITVCVTFCAERYQGVVVTKSLLPDKLYIEKGVSWMTVVGEAHI